MKRFLFPTAVFVLGVLCGASLSTVLMGSQIDALYIENMSLQENLLTMEKQVQQLRDKPQKKVVDKIVGHVEFTSENDFNEFEKSIIKLTVEKNIREWLKPIYGQALAEVNYQLIPGVINREIEIDQIVVSLAVKMIVISELVEVWVEVQPWQGHSNKSIDVLNLSI